jgi:dTDP-4-amino-4,6-dideoxygalactose transaminase
VTEFVPFNLPRVVGQELEYIRAAIRNGNLSAGGEFTDRCCAWLERETTARRALLVHSCTAALEMAALLLEIEPGDEIVMPSFTFVSTANAFVLRGGVPVFVDVRHDTLNIDESQIEAAITSRTRAIVAVHYAGVPAEMDEIGAIARRHDLVVIEDAAQALMSTYRDKPAGSFGAAAALSFHETKNVIAGEGGALLVNDDRWLERADVIRDKGTDRQKFFHGEVDRYSWVDVGSSYGLGEIGAAFLCAQLEMADEIVRDRLRTWNLYHEAFAALDNAARVRRPVVPEHCRHNGHIYYLIVATLDERRALLEELARRGVSSVFHYVPLHSSEGGLRYGRFDAPLVETDAASDGLVRLPLWFRMTEDDVVQVAQAVGETLGARIAL